MANTSWKRLAPALLAIATCALVTDGAAAQTCSGPLRKINIGVSVTPPNVAHTTPYVAKALGFFAKHCIDANIMQFDGGQSPAALAAVNQGTAIANVTDVAIGRGAKAQQIWGFAPRMPQSYIVSADVKDARRCARRTSRPTTRSSSRKQPPAGSPASSPGSSTARRCIRKMRSWPCSRSPARTC
jgi:hypothetical protein